MRTFFCTCFSISIKSNRASFKDQQCPHRDLHYMSHVLRVSVSDYTEKSPSFCHLHQSEKFFEEILHSMKLLAMGSLNIQARGLLKWVLIPEPLKKARQATFNIWAKFVTASAVEITGLGPSSQTSISKSPRPMACSPKVEQVFHLMYHVSCIIVLIFQQNYLFIRKEMKSLR